MVSKDKMLGSLSRKLKTSSIGKLYRSYRQYGESKYIARHFSSYLEPVIASSPSLEEMSYRIRHNVYCDELNFEEARESGMETDEFDDYSLHCLIKHTTTDEYAGTVRLVRPTQEGQELPIEKYCISSINNDSLNPRNFNRLNICEISRLAVPKRFRRREMDKYDGAAVGVINQQTYSELELRCFPFIAVGLYFAAAATAIERDVQHAYVMMEPRLARSMSFVGIKFEQIGPVINYHGRRAPYYINQPLLQNSLKPNFAVMLHQIREQIRKQG
ncbi:PEP-CTERM/exosortase system-associated acyltransferase [Alteromonas sp. ASW11-130]|uniref:PEP-CTERM/exosortase system-associated acyltransferase n=1 Tax=Alteromonas sp. ASW11-130 TaxID=3015775 RepID=UPI002241B893|nr:PEP-CTERM/exosortase system-associated acyltransferase [Alteromonas sp. ASW11-130]MCW8091303.1 PEP-CTERM/exosortase system-associated acyltransferase [Alteromonas sp. ASW11-130]